MRAMVAGAVFLSAALVSCDNAARQGGRGTVIAEKRRNEDVEVACSIEAQNGESAFLKVSVKNIGNRELLIDHQLVCLLWVSLWDHDGNPLDPQTQCVQGRIANDIRPLAPGAQVSRTIWFGADEPFVATSVRYDKSMRPDAIYAYEIKCKMPLLSQVGRIAVVYGNQHDQVAGLRGVIGEEKALALYGENVVVTLVVPSPHR